MIRAELFVVKDNDHEMSIRDVILTAVPRVGEGFYLHVSNKYKVPHWHREAYTVLRVDWIVHIETARNVPEEYVDVGHEYRTSVQIFLRKNG